MPHPETATTVTDAYDAQGVVDPRCLRALNLVMIVLLAGITGITDVAALITLFGVTASMILFGWLMETTNHPGRESALAWQIFANVLTG